MNKKTILELNHNEIRQYFLNKESYCEIDLPKYFDFQELLNNISNKIEEKDFKSAICKNNSLPGKFEKVNYTLLESKDGKYAWRPLQLINPALYVFLVREITQKDNWELIVSQFVAFQKNNKIKCYSIPLVDTDANTPKPPEKRSTILNWWESIEQQSLEMALEYDYFLNTDITDCYGSIYTHTIPWALHSKDIAKTKRADNKLIGNCIDTTIQGMSYGQTNGIPQGSVLMDFIAEIVLGYADLRITEELEKNNIVDYMILRYRDDYRIFSNNQETITKLVKVLTDVLRELNFRLNSQKTFMSNNIVSDAIKPDKLYWLERSNFIHKRNRKNVDNTKDSEDDTNNKNNINLQKTLLLIHSLSTKFPNSGSVATAMSDFQRIVYCDNQIRKEDINAIISIVVDIAYKNPRVYHMVTAILSKLLSLLKDKNEINLIMESIDKKFQKIPNVGHLQIWLQRLTLKIDKDKDYPESLCKRVNDRNTPLWQNDWLNDAIKQVIDNTLIIDYDFIWM
jgi:hypothetical protein